MRDPRPDLEWSRRRVTIRAAYGAYIGSPAWYRRRERWLQEWRTAHHGAEPVCQVCGREWTLRHGDLHRRSYTRLGREHWRDLMPICRACHHTLHAWLEHNPSWRRMPREQATDQIAAKLRSRERKISNGRQRAAR